MNTSSRFIVATHIMVGMALKRRFRCEDDCVTSEFLAKSVNTNPVVIRRMLSKLRQAGLVTSHPGPVGGSQLVLTPEKISLLAIYEAVEEASLFHLHHNRPNMNCPVGANIQCSLEEVFDQAENAMKQALAQRTLDEVTSDIMTRSGTTELIAAGLSPDQIMSAYKIEDGRFVKKD